MENKIDVYKITLATGKVVILRDMEIQFEDMAIQAVGDKAGKNEVLFGKMMQDELLKILLMEIDGEALTGSQKESFKKLLTYREIAQIRKAMQQIMGDPEGPKLETVSSSGSK